MKNVCIGLLLACVTMGAQAEPFSYQGKLNFEDAPANGEFDLVFRMYDDEVGGTQIGSTLTFDDVDVVDGVFQLELDFGINFEGEKRWLHIHAREGDSNGGYTGMLPRPRILSTPMAQHALVADEVTNPTWYDVPNALRYGQGTSRVLINRDEPITTSELFGIHSDGAGFVGMYVSGVGASYPFYGYSVNGEVNAYTYYDSLDDQWILWKAGLNALVIEQDLDAVFVRDVEADDFKYSSTKTITTSVSGNVFQSPTIGHWVSRGSGGFFTTETGSAAASAPITLPDGARVVSMTAYVDDTAPGTMIISLSRQDHGATNFQSVCYATTSDLSGSLEIFDSANPTLAIIDHSQYHYHLRVWSSSWPGDTTMRITSVVVRYEVDSPQ